MAESELRVAHDVWMQMLAVLAVVSGLWTAAERLPRPWAAPRAAPSGAPPRAGPWIVDARGGAEAEFRTLGAAIAAAGDGDSILLRPGVYEESVAISKSLSISGSGRQSSEVTLTSGGERTVSVTGGRVFFKNLTLANGGGPAGAAAAVDKATLTLEHAEVQAAGDGLRTRDGALEVSDATIAARRGVVVAGASKASLLRAEVRAQLAGLSIEGLGEARLERSRLSASQGTGARVSRFARLRLVESSISGCASAAVAATSGAEVTILRSRLAANRGCGVTLDGASASIERARLEGERCGVGFLGPGSLDTEQSEYVGLDLGALAIRPGHEREATLRGGGNLGLEVPAKAGFPVAPSRASAAGLTPH